MEDTIKQLEEINSYNFKANIEASRYILAGTPEIAMHIMSDFTNEDMTIIRRNCKLLLRKTSRMSSEQVICLRSKITIIDILLSERTKQSKL